MKKTILVFLLLATLSYADLAQDRQLILNLTNQARANVGSNPLVLDDSLNSAAQGHSVYMANTGDFSHIQSATGSTPSDRAGEPVGQNIAYGYNLTNIHTMWMNSPGHKANIQNNTYGRLGVGIAIRNDGRIYATQVFGFPDQNTPVPDGVSSDVSDVVDQIYGHIGVSTSLINNNMAYFIQQWIDLGKPQGSWPFNYLFSNGFYGYMSAYMMTTSLSNLQSISNYNPPSSTQDFGVGVQINGSQVKIYCMSRWDP